MHDVCPKRKTNRLKQFDYSQNGAYFITICTHNRKEILSQINAGDGSPVPKLTIYGDIVLKLINEISNKYPNVIVDKYVIMPNHIHIILAIINHNGTGDPSPTISNIVAWLKYTSTKEMNSLKKSAGTRIFQRSFYDHIIRNEADYLNIWQYIEDNPLRWHDDKYYTGDDKNGFDG